MQPEIERLCAAGLAALHGDDLAAAAQFFGRAVTLQPASHAAWNGLAWARLRAGDFETALQHAQRAHELSRRNVDYLNTLGAAYGEAGKLAEAEASFRKALKLRPGHVDSLVNLGKALEKHEQRREAITCYERALALSPRMPKLATNLALLHRLSGDVARARSVLAKSEAAIEPQDYAMAMAECDVEEGQIEPAAERLARALQAHPDWMLARNTHAHLLLGAGRWQEAWQQYLWRRFERPSNAGHLLPPRLEGRRLLVRGEQGIGDVLFFMRFVPLLQARGAAVALECEGKLHPLLADSGLLVAGGPFDEATAIGDLPALLGSEDAPPAWPVAVSEDEMRAARERLAALGAGRCLAVTWRAGMDTARGREFGAEHRGQSKSTPPRQLGEALRGWRGPVVLLQRGARAGEAEEFTAGLGAACHDLSALGEDLRALAAVLAVVDEYVAVSNANIHILAGLKRTAKVLVPRPAEWRWMHSGDESPWFPGFKLYRQPLSRDWSETLARLRKDLLG